MNIIFLDIDGVLNCRYTKERYNGFIGIDENILSKFKRIFDETDARIVLSSTWRLMKGNIDYLKEEKKLDIIDITPNLFEGPDKCNQRKDRGYEIQDWLDRHLEVKNYLILDDDSDMLPGQNFFKTNIDTGITEEIIEKVIKHFKGL